VIIRDFKINDLYDIDEVLKKSTVNEQGYAEARRLLNLVVKFYKLRPLISFLKMLHKEPTKILVADVDKRVVGVVLVTLCGKAGRIGLLEVHPNYRRKGIATRLMKSAVAEVSSDASKLCSL